MCCPADIPGCPFNMARTVRKMRPCCPQKVAVCKHVAKLAIQQFGSVEKYTEEMKHNLEHFSEIMDEWYSQVPEEMLKEDKFLKLASHKGEDVASEPVQSIVEEIIASIQTTTSKLLVGSAENYCRMMIDTYSNDYLITYN